MVSPRVDTSSARARPRPTAGGSFTLTLTVREGWHLAAGTGEPDA